MPDKLEELQRKVELFIQQSQAMDDEDLVMKSLLSVLYDAFGDGLTFDEVWNAILGAKSKF